MDKIAAWLHMEDGTYVAEMSELDARTPLVGVHNAPCPRCRAPIGQAGSWSAHKSSDGDVALWTRTHTCGAVLTIFND